MYYKTVTIDIPIKEFCDNTYSSFEYYLKTTKKKITGYKIIIKNNHIELYGLIDNQWTKIKVCKTIKGALKAISNFKKE